MKKICAWIFAVSLTGCMTAPEKSMGVRVEGAFLRISHEGIVRVDRKLHFRAIVDYALVEGPLMKHLGITGLHMTTTSGSPQGILQLWGVADGEAVRDQLALIDSLREKEWMPKTPLSTE